MVIETEKVIPVAIDEEEEEEDVEDESCMSVAQLLRHSGNFLKEISTVLQLLGNAHCPIDILADLFFFRLGHVKSAGNVGFLKSLLPVKQCVPV